LKELLETFIVRISPSHRFDHWQGGEPTDGNAVCPRCDQPLQLFWDIDASDPRFRSSTKQITFGDLRRILLYWCVPCFSSLDYQLVNGTINILAADGRTGNRVEKKKRDPTFPYDSFPQSFARRPIDLLNKSDLPTEVVNLLTETPIPKLTATGKRMLEAYVGHTVSQRGFAVMRTWAHQFGGSPHLPQGDDTIVCCNKKCNSYNNPMYAIAAIHNDPPNDLPIIETKDNVTAANGYFNFFVTLYFHMCAACKSIHAHSQGS
jgi:hypothetical protein